MRIMLAVDGSKPSIKAVRTFVSHLDWFGGRAAVRLVNVQPPVPRIRGGVKAGWNDAVGRHEQTNGEKALSAAQALLREAGVKFSSGVLVGEPAQSMIAEAAKENCDLIYMGTRGMGAIANLLLGSVATKVLHLSQIPVILVR